MAQKKHIGLKYNEGLLGETRNRSHTVEKQFKSFSKTLDDQTVATIERLNSLKIAFIGLVVLVIFGFIFKISRTINHQVSTLLSAIQEIADSNNVSLRASFTRQDELSEIGRYFNRLLDKLEDLISGTQKKSSRLSNSTSNMHDELQKVMDQFQNIFIKIQMNLLMHLQELGLSLPIEIWDQEHVIWVARFQKKN